MPRLRSLLLAATALLVVAPAAHGQATPPTGPVPQPNTTPAPTAPARGYPAQTPRPGALYHAGPSGRYLLGGTWLFRFDPTDKGVSQGFQRNASTAGWSRVSVPNAWNATDQTAASFVMPIVIAVTASIAISVSSLHLAEQRLRRLGES